MNDRSPRALETAVRRHHASQMVLYESASLDRELSAPRPNWEALLQKLAGFMRHYPTVLLREPEATTALLDGCRRALSAPSAGIRATAARLVMELLLLVADKGLAQDTCLLDWKQTIRTARQIVAELGSSRVEPEVSGDVFSSLLQLGRLVVAALEDREPVDDWLELLEELTRLSLSLAAGKLAGEPVYDGRWDGHEQAAQLAAEQLEPLRAERLAAESEWLRQLSRRLEGGERQPMDVFLELATYQRRDERHEAWKQWKGAVSGRAQAEGFTEPAFRELCRICAEWTVTIGDRYFLQSLAEMLSAGLLPRVPAGCETFALETLANAVVLRLENEAGRGPADSALYSLWRAGRELLESILHGINEDARGLAGALVLRLRLGPLEGAPLQAAELAWWLRLSREYPQLADVLLPRILVGHALEDFVLHEPPRERGRLAQALCRALAHPWPPRLSLAVRTMLRLVPLPAFALGGPVLRTQANTLAVAGEGGGYLEEFAGRLLGASPGEGLKMLDALLESWHGARAEPLLDWLSPEKMITFDSTAEATQLEALRHLLDSLRRAFGSEPAAGWEFLDLLGPEFEQAGTLNKVIGFEGCPAGALERLALVIALWHNLQGRLAVLGEQATGSDPRDWLDAAEELLGRRVGLAGEISRLADSDSMACLDSFSEEIGTSAQAELLLGRALAAIEKDWAGGDAAARLFSLLLEHARLSQLGGDWMPELDREPGAPWPGKAAAVLKHIESERLRWRELLRPQVADSLARLRRNPLARPRPEAAQWLERAPDDAALLERLLDLVLAALLEAEGFLPLLERLCRTNY